MNIAMIGAGYAGLVSGGVLVQGMAIPLLVHMIWCAVDQAINLSKRLRIMFAVAPQMKRSS